MARGLIAFGFVERQHIVSGSAAEQTVDFTAEIQQKRARDKPGISQPPLRACAQSFDGLPHISTTQKGPFFLPVVPTRTIPQHTGLLQALRPIEKSDGSHLT